MTEGTLALWLLDIAVAIVGFLISLFQTRNLIFPRSYLAYFGVAGLVQLLSKIMGSGQYPNLFWVLEVVHNVLLCMICIEIVSRLLPREYVRICSSAAFLILAISFVLQAASNVMEAFLNLSISASFVGGILLVFIFFIKVRWTREYRVTTAGIIALLSADVISLFVARGGTGSSLISQLGPIPGLVLLSVAGSFQKKTHPPAGSDVHDSRSYMREFGAEKTEFVSAGQNVSPS